MAALPLPRGWDALHGLVKFFLSLFMGILGMLLFSISGSLAYPVGGIGAIVGGIIGAVLFFVCGCFVTGYWRECLPEPREADIKTFLPNTLSAMLGEHGNFTLVLTVHEVRDVAVRGYLPWVRPDFYVEVECGDNPIKSTCVKKDGRFNEQFRIDVTPKDESILLWVKDQDFFGADTVGYTILNIDRHIIREGFPVKKEFAIESDATSTMRWQTDHKEKCGKLVVSFDHTQDYGAPISDKVQDSRRKFKQDAESAWNSQNYGAVGMLQTVQFNSRYAVSGVPLREGREGRGLV